MKKYILLFSSVIMIKFAAAQNLERHLWKDRVILLFTASFQQAHFQEQSDILTEETKEVTDRGLIVYTILPDGGQQPDGGVLSAVQAKALYHTYGITPGVGFTFVLIGKDGTEKLKKKQPVSTQELFSLIDSMPMRKAEMSRNRRKGDKKNEKNSTLICLLLYYPLYVLSVQANLRRL